MLSLRQKALVTATIVGMNVLVFVFLSWFVVLTAIPSIVLLGVLLSR